MLRMPKPAPLSISRGAYTGLEKFGEVTIRDNHTFWSLPAAVRSSESHHSLGHRRIAWIHDNVGV